MTILSFLGCLFIAYGPVLAILFLYVGKHASLVLLTIASMFMWLMGAFCASLVWLAIVYVCLPFAELLDPFEVGHPLPSFLQLRLTSCSGGSFTF
jgi:hypothetical protein